MRFQTEERVPRVNESKINGENTFNGDHFEIESNHGSRKNKKVLLWVFLQIRDKGDHLGIEGNHGSSKDTKFCFEFFGDLSPVL